MAAENLMLAADALGVGSCYIGQVAGPPSAREIFGSVGHPRGPLAVCQVLLGYPRPGDPTPPSP